jgi:hypothetical protein
MMEDDELPEAAITQLWGQGGEHASPDIPAS